jgi:PAS domain S-box-containing protein
MKIKTKLYLNLTVFFFLVAILTLVIFFTSRLMAQENRKLESVHQLQISLFELNVLSHEYLLYREDRMEAQWNARYNSAVTLLRRIAPTDRGEQVEWIKGIHKELGERFTSLIENHRKLQNLTAVGADPSLIEAARSLEKRLMSRLLVTSQTMMAACSKLSEEAQEGVRYHLKMTGTAILTVFGILALSVLAASITTTQTISRSLKKLSWGVKMIGQGEFDHQIAISSNDELGQLSTAFNKMTQRLKAITASRDRLNEEVAERKRVEAALEKLNVELETLVQKRSAELAESEEVLRNAFQLSPIGKALAATDGRFLKVNIALCRILGYSQEELLAKSLQDLAHPDDPGADLAYLHEVLAGKFDTYELEMRLLHKQKQAVWAQLYVSLARNSAGQPLFFILQIQDITHRKQAEKQTEHLNTVLRTIRSVNQLVVRERDRENLICEACRLLVENRGYASSMIVLVDENNQPVSWTAEGIDASVEALNIMFVEGNLPSCCDRARPGPTVVRIDEREFVCGNCPVANKLDEKQSLSVALSYKDAIFGYLTADLDRDIEADAEELSLFTEMAEDLSYALNTLQEIKDKEASERQRESLARQLAQAQKMESIGRLAGGVAHDYNNALSAIVGFTELAMTQTDSNPHLHDDLNEVLSAANRATDITRQLLAFARKQTIAPKVLDLNEIVEETLKMLRRLIGENIDLVWLPKNGLWPVKADPSQIDQILTNLCVNARDAIEDVGKVTIETDMVVIDKAYSAMHAGFIPGEFVMLAVSDNGCGIEEEIQENIFEPFFTTKGVDKGTGLGLAMIYGIVKQNKGFINVYSEPGEGTTIKIYLPRQADEGVQIFEDGSVENPPGHGETVLLVEDDTSVLKLARQILDRLDYIVLTASTPGEAMVLTEKHSGEIHLLITDVIMPEMNGRDLAERLQSLYPHIKPIFMSGYTADVIARHGVLDEGVNYLQKPFSKTDLAKMVRQVLDN